MTNTGTNGGEGGLAEGCSVVTLFESVLEASRRKSSKKSIKRSNALSQSSQASASNVSASVSSHGGRATSVRKEIAESLAKVDDGDVRQAVRENIENDSLLQFLRAVFLGSPRWGEGSEEGLSRRICVYEEFISLVAAGEVLCFHASSQLSQTEKKQAEGIVEYLRQETEQLPEKVLPCIIEMCLDGVLGSSKERCSSCCVGTLLSFVPKMICRSSCMGNRADPDGRCKQPAVSLMSGAQYQEFAISFLCKD